MHPRAAHGPPRRHRGAVAPASLPLPCREFRPHGETAPMSRDEMLLRACGRRDLVTGIVELVLGRIPAESQPDRRSRLRIIETQCAKHVTRTTGSAGAG